MTGRHYRGGRRKRGATGVRLRAAGRDLAVALSAGALSLAALFVARAAGAGASGTATAVLVAVVTGCCLAAVLALTGAMLTGAGDSGRWVYLGLALAGLGLVAAPGAILIRLSDPAPPPIAVAMAVGGTGVAAVLLLRFALAAARRRAGTEGTLLRWSGGATAVLVALVTGAAFTDVEIGTTGWHRALWIAAGAGLIGALGVAVSGGRRRNRTELRAGVCLALLVAVPAWHATTAVDGTALRNAGPLAAAVGLVLAMGSAVVHTVRRNRRDEAVLQARFVELEARLRGFTEDAQERAHELRNGLAGIAGAARALAGDDGDGAERSALFGALQGEVSRLQLLVVGDGPAEVARELDLAAALGRIVLVERAAGRAVTLDPAAAGTAWVAPGAFTQTVVNLLANCARHAPGADVRLAVRRLGDVVQVAVADDGPGIAEARIPEVFRRGGRSLRGGGSGVGLTVSARLVAEQHGVLRVVPTPPGGRGCLVVMELPAVRPATPPPPTPRPRSKRGADESTDDHGVVLAV